MDILPATVGYMTGCQPTIADSPHFLVVVMVSSGSMLVSQLVVRLKVPSQGHGGASNSISFSSLILVVGIPLPLALLASRAANLDEVDNIYFAHQFMLRSLLVTLVLLFLLLLTPKAQAHGRHRLEAWGLTYGLEWPVGTCNNSVQPT